MSQKEVKWPKTGLKTNSHYETTAVTAAWIHSSNRKEVRFRRIADRNGNAGQEAKRTASGLHEPDKPGEAYDRTVADVEHRIRQKE